MFLLNETLDGGSASAGFYAWFDRRPRESHTPEKSVLRISVTCYLTAVLFGKVKVPVRGAPALKIGGRSKGLRRARFPSASAARSGRRSDGRHDGWSPLGEGLDGNQCCDRFGRLLLVRLLPHDPIRQAPETSFSGRMRFERQVSLE